MNRKFIIGFPSEIFQAKKYLKKHVENIYEQSPAYNFEIII